MPCCPSETLSYDTVYAFSETPLPVLHSLAGDQVPAVSLEPRITFFRGLPKVGAYVAAAVPADGTDPSQVSRQVLGIESSLTVCGLQVCNAGRPSTIRQHPAMSVCMMVLHHA
jgi:hypothetical protein